MSFQQSELPARYERYLGRIHQGWLDKSSLYKIQIVGFRNQPEPGVTTFARLGMSRYVLDLSGSREIRQELFVSVNEGSSEPEVASFVLSLSENIVKRRHAALRGEVLGPQAPLVSEASVTLVYITNPSPFDKSFTDFVFPPPALVFAYAFPITNSEAMLVAKHGWRWFENALEEQKPDVRDLTRSEEVSFQV
jgi:hypothetical protein